MVIISIKKFIEDLNYLYHGIIHSGMLQTFWTFFNITAYTTNAKIFYKNRSQNFLGLNLVAEDYQYVTELWSVYS